MERNFQKCCDPTVKNYASIYRKNYYELPADYLVPKKFDAGSDSEEIEKNKVNMQLNDLHLENANQSKH